MSAEKSKEEIIALLSEKAAKDGDNFRVKIFRQSTVGGGMETVATLSNATLRHFDSPEEWVPYLVGGGPIFLLNAYHFSDQTRLLGIIRLFVPVDNMPPKNSGQIDPSVLTREDWMGPRKLEYPKLAPRAENGAYTALPPAPPTGAVPPHASGGGFQPGAGFSPSQGSDAMHVVKQAQIEQERAALNRQREELLQTQHKMELDMLRREAEARMAALEAKLTASVRVEQPKGLDMVGLIGAMAPILAPILQSSNEARAQMAKMQQESAAQIQSLMLAMMNKPAVDPMTEKLMDKMQSMMDSAKKDTPQFDAVKQMMEAMGSMSTQYMEIVQAAAEMAMGGQKPEEPPILRAVREGVKALGGVMAAGAQRQQQQQPMPMQMPQIPNPAAFPMPGAPQLAPQAADAPRAPAQVVPFNSKPITVQPAMANPLPVSSSIPLIDKIEQQIRNKADAASIVRIFLENLNEPSIHAAIVSANESVEELFLGRLGAWAADPDNADYVGELMREVERQGKEAGLVDDVSEDEDDDDSEGDDDGEEGAGYPAD